jgi:hypothetical protein
VTARRWSSARRRSSAVRMRACKLVRSEFIHLLPSVAPCLVGFKDLLRRTLEGRWRWVDTQRSSGSVVEGGGGSGVLLSMQKR